MKNFVCTLSLALALAFGMQANESKAQGVDANETFAYATAPRTHETGLMKVENVQQLMATSVASEKTLNISFTALLSEPVTLSIYDADGIIIMVKQLQTTEGQNSVSTNLSSYPAGLYQIKVRNLDGQSLLTKVHIQ
jgi:hypothetical protein